MGAASAASAAGTPERTSKSQVADTPDQGVSSSGQSVVDGQIQGASMFSDSLMGSVLPASSSKLMPSISDRWRQDASR